MNADQVLQTIKSRGHWRVNIRPSVFDPQRIPNLSTLRSALGSARVSLRGWPYPYFDPNDPPALLTDHIQQLVSWEGYHELWRLYQSGQFIHLFSMREDWWESGAPPRIDPGTVLSLGSTLYTVTEIFLFAARLAEHLGLGPDVSISYKVVGIGGRQLTIFEPGRVPLGHYRRTSQDLAEFGQERTESAEALISGAAEMAVDEVLKIYERFTWTPAREDVIEDQRKFLQRRNPHV
jgi:hypothetical protein